MPVVLGATTRSTIFPQRCRPRELLPRNSTPKNLGSKKQSRPTARLPHGLVSMSPLSLIARKRKKSIGKRSKTGKTLFRLPETTPLRVKKVIENATIAKRRVILQGTARNLQKTSISLGNFRIGDWWWWRGCQGTLHLLSGLISGKPGTRRPEAAKGLAW